MMPSKLESAGKKINSRSDKVHINSYFSVKYDFWNTEITWCKVVQNIAMEYYGIIWKYHNAVLEQQKQE